MTGNDNAEDQTLLANTPAQVKSLLHYQEHAAVGTAVYANINKPEFILF